MLDVLAMLSMQSCYHTIHTIHSIHIHIHIRISPRAIASPDATRVKSRHSPREGG